MNKRRPAKGKPLRQRCLKCDRLVPRSKIWRLCPDCRETNLLIDPLAEGVALLPEVSEAW